MRRYGDPAKVLAALPDLARRSGRVVAPRVPSIADAEREIEAGERLGARLIAACEPDFPALLAALNPPPPLIWARGDPSLLSRPCVAVVGARIASAAGQRFARTPARDPGQAGQAAVSGLARGVDGAAHEGALPTGAAAALGGGVDDIYPPEHTALYGSIAERGCVVSESPVGHRAQARDFPRRNRLISGLSAAVVVVEAEMKSGSLITARLAGEQGREVLAAPGSPLDPRAKGTNDLIRQGAAICEGPEDVLRALAALPALREGEADHYRAAPSDEDGLDAAVDVRDRIKALLSPTPTAARRAGPNHPHAGRGGLCGADGIGPRAELLSGDLVAKG
jgi:DNA processing protein